MIWFPHGTVGASLPSGPPPASNLVREASGMLRENSPNGTDRTFVIPVPVSLTNSLLVYGITWFTGANTTVSTLDFNGVDVIADEVGTQQSGNVGDTRDGMFMGFVGNPTSGDIDLDVTMSASMGTDDVTLVYWIYSGADVAGFPNAFIDPEHISNLFEYVGNMTTTEDDCAQGFMIADFFVSAQGTIDDAGWNDVTPDLSFTEGWFNDDVGAAGAKSFTWEKDNADVTVAGFSVAPA